MPSIIQVLNSFHVNKTTTLQIEQIENFYKRNKSFSLKDLLKISTDDENLNDNPIFNQLKKSLERVISFSQNPDNSELEGIKNTIQKKIKEIGQKDLTNKAEILGSLKKAQEELSGFVRQTQTIKTDEKRKAAYVQAKKALTHADEEVLKANIKKNNKNIKDIAELYKLTNPNIISLARFFSLKEEIFKTEKEHENNLIICLDFLKDKLNLSTENITLSDLEKIFEWSKFKVSLQTKFEKNKRKNDVSSTSSIDQNSPQTSEESLKLFKENQQLIKEIAELKEKISFLETQSIDSAYSSKENPLIDRGNEAENLAIELHSLKTQSAAKITELNHQLSQINEKNEQLTAGIDSNKELNVKQQQTISNLSDELASLKAKLKAKEKQVTENSTQLKQREDQFNQIENELIKKNKSALEKASHEIKKLTDDLTNASKKLEEQNKTLNQKEIELNVLSNEKSKIEFQIQQLNDALQEKKYNDGQIGLKEEEILKLTEQLKQLKEQFKQEKDNLTSNSHAHDYKISRLESDINEKELSLEQLKNELDSSKKIVTQHKHQINILKTNLELKEQELNQSKLQLQTLTEQSEHLSDQKNTLEQKYKAELADSLARYKALQSQLSSTTEDFGEKLNSLLEKNTSSEKENQELKGNLESFKMNLEKEKASLLKAEKEISALTNTLSSLQSDLASTNQNFHAQLETTKAEKENLVKEYDLFISEVDKILYATKNHVSSFAQLDYLSEEHNQILKKLHTLKGKIDINEDLEDENSHLKNQISELEFNSEALESETIKKLTSEKQTLEEQVLALETQVLKMEQFRNDDQAFISNKNLDFEFDEDSENPSDDEDGIFSKNISTSDPNAELDPYILFAKQLESTQKLLRDKEVELEQKTNELEQLQNQLLMKESEVENLKTKTQKETDDLASRLTETQENLNASKSEIASIKKSSEETETKLSQRINEKEALIQKFEKQIQSQTSEFERLQTNLTKELSNKQEELNSLLDEQKGKSKNIEQLKDKLKQNEHNLSVSHKKFNDLEKELLITKENLSRIKVDLEQTEKALAQSQDSSGELSNERNKLKKAIEDFQKNDSDLQKKYDTLIEASQEKSVQIDTLTNKIKDIQSKLEISQQEATDLNQKIKALETIKEDLEQKLRTDNITTLGGGMPTNTEVDLIDLGSGSIPNEELIKSKINLSKTDSSSSGNFSGQSSSHTSSENLNVFPDADDVNEPFIKNVSRSSQGQFNDSDGEDELENSTLIQPLNPIPSKPTSEQLDTLEEVKQGVNAAFKQENHPAIIEAFTKEFSRIASHAAHTSFNGEFVDELPEFQEKLQEISENEIKGLVSALLNNTSLQSCVYEKIQTKGLGQLTYLEEVKHSASLIFNNLTIKQPNKNDQKYHDYIYDKANHLLIKLCIENLQTKQNEHLIELAKNSLEKQATDNGLQTTEHSAIIQKAATELVTRLFETSHLQNTLKELIKNPTPSLNLLVASTQKLHDQLKEQINHNFDHYFPSLHLDPILEKINNGKALSDEEITKLPSELQYADTIEEFVAGLRVEHPNLPPHYENQLNEDTFKQLRLILRKHALSNLSSAISITLSDADIFDLNAKAWLENQLHLMTGTTIYLEKIELEKKQKNLLSELDAALQLPSFCDISLTPKSIIELKAEIKEFSQTQLTAEEEKNKYFTAIENKQKEYFKINDDPVPEFLKKLAKENHEGILRFNEEGSKKLFSTIDKHLFKIGRWDYLNVKIFNYKLKDITNELLSTIPSNHFDREPLEKTIKYAIGFLCEKHKRDKLKRTEILKDIALFYASTKKYSDCFASDEVTNRKVKTKNFLGLKEEKDQEVRTLTGNTSAIYQGILLPHNLIVIADTCDPSLEKPIDSEFSMLADSFYAKDAMKTGQTITFEQKLNNGKSREWSVTKNATSLTYNTSSWADRLKNVGGRIRNKIDPFNSAQLNAEDKEVIFAAFSHAIASSKGSVLTLSIGANCSKEKEVYLRLLIENFNRNQRISGQKISILINNNDKINVNKNTKKAINNEIFAKNSPSKELDNAIAQSKEINRNIRPRGL